MSIAFRTRVAVVLAMLRAPIGADLVQAASYGPKPQRAGRLSPPRSSHQDRVATRQGAAQQRATKESGSLDVSRSEVASHVNVAFVTIDCLSCSF